MWEKEELIVQPLWFFDVILHAPSARGTIIILLLNSTKQTRGVVVGWREVGLSVVGHRESFCEETDSLVDVRERRVDCLVPPYTSPFGWISLRTRIGCILLQKGATAQDHKSHNYVGCRPMRSVLIGHVVQRKLRCR